MPKQSKIRSPGARSGTQETKPEATGVFTCTRCGVSYRIQRHNFPSSQSPLFAKNNGFLPICGNCLDTLFSKYRDTLGSESAAAKRVCMKMDIYWNERLFESTVKSINKENYSSLIRCYINKTNLIRFAGKTYDDTLIEESAVWEAAKEAKEREAATGELSDSTPKLEDVEFWGEGYSTREYDLLNKKYEQWVANHANGDEEAGELPVGTSTLYRQICTLEMQINRNMIAGKPTESAINQLNNLIGSVNARPNQTSGDGVGGTFDSMPFGMGIRIFENTKPIPKPLPQLEDVDGIVRYISIWFLGHLCKMLHIKNCYCKMYEEEIERLRVSKPELEGEDDETVFNNIFGDGD